MKYPVVKYLRARGMENESSVFFSQAVLAAATQEMQEVLQQRGS